MSSNYYLTAPMSGWFLVDLARHGDDLAYGTSIEADSPEDLAVKANAYAAEYGFTVVGATFAGRPVPGVGAAR